MSIDFTVTPKEGTPAYCPVEEGHGGIPHRHGVAMHKRFPDTIWRCDWCGDRLTENPDRDFGGFISIEPYTIEEEPV